MIKTIIIYKSLKFLCLVKAIEDPVRFYVEKLFSSFGGIGTNEDNIIRIIISRSEVWTSSVNGKTLHNMKTLVVMNRNTRIIHFYLNFQIDMRDIKVEFQKRNQKSLSAMLKADFPGDSKNMLLAILGDN